MARSPTIEIRPAIADDLAVIVGLHEADSLGGHGDRWSPRTRGLYEAAFSAIADSPADALFVALHEGEVVGTFQLTLIPVLTGLGRRVARLGSVQVRADQRSRGIGAAMVEAAEREAARRGAALVELASNLARRDAHRFYERLGYAKSHAGFKKVL